MWAILGDPFLKESLCPFGQFLVRLNKVTPIRTYPKLVDKLNP